MAVVNSGYVLTNVEIDAANSITFDPSTPAQGVLPEAGDQAFAVVVANASGGNVWTPPAGWTEVQPAWGQIGTFLVKSYVRTWQAGDAAQTFQMSGTARWLQGCMFWVSGVKAPAVIGVPKGRQDEPKETLTTTAPGLAVPAGRHRVVSFAFERTTVTETPDQISMSGSNRWFVLAHPAHSTNIATVSIATLDVAGASTTEPVTFTYPNGQGTNGWGFQVALPEDVPQIQSQTLIKTSTGLVDATGLYVKGQGNVTVWGFKN